MTSESTKPPSGRNAIAVLSFLLCAAAQGQSTAPVAPAPPPAAASAAGEPTGLASLAWLEGCWSGVVNKRDFREQWTPLRGGLMLGLGHTVMEDRTQNFEYLRLESRPDGVYYVAIPSGQRETAFRLVSTTTDDKDTIFTFANPQHDFPQQIVYRRGSAGWLYATIEGKLKGEDRKVIYPMQRIDCATGELIKK